jgi:primosomal protein N' (replication factor Y) (superfamily II helicase)
VIAAKVAVENTVYHFDKPFDYYIPDSLLSTAREGCRVLVPFGRANAKRQGIILERIQMADGEGQKLKAIASVLDQEPLLSQEALRMIPWIAEHTFCTLYEAARLFLPAGILFQVSDEYMLAGPADEIAAKTENAEQAQIVAYLSHRKAVKKEKLLKDLGLSADSGILDRMLRKGFIQKNSTAFRRIGDATQKMVRFTEPQTLPKLTPKQKCVLEVLRSAGTASVKEVCYFAGVTPVVVDALVKKGVAQYFDAEIYRNPYKKMSLDQTPSLPRAKLTAGQEEAYRNLYNQYRSGKGGVSLLYGVTGSGKTQVFMNLIDRVLEDGRGVIVMVPEISLTPQTISLFHARYGGGVAVFHSGLSLGERLDEWKRIKNGSASIVVGTRSAVFAPFENLGLIIMDEEQEGTYKSESTPRYHAREIAKYRCAYHKCLLVLSSATPSVESYYNALSGKYTLNVLPERFGPARLPEVEVVDMNKEIEKGNTGILSETLAASLRKNFENGMQSILLLNRRGYNTFASCRACGHVATCPNCSISLTYHAANNRLMCHYCGYSIPFTRECPNCHAERMRYSGFGTQRAEEQLAQLLPEARILRLDADSTMTRFAYDKKLKQFSEGAYDIIIGTQMVAKGLDFENVTLVGVLSADQALYGDDFRSYERAFDLLTQVVGRSGRGKYEGKAVIQTFTPENVIIKLAAQQNYTEFYQQEIALRKSLLYPPYSDICVIGFAGREEKRVQAASMDFFTLLCKTAQESYSDQPLRVLRPSPARIERVSNRYRYKLIVKCRNNRRIRKMISDLLIQFSADRKHADVTAFADMNPETIF